MKTRTSHNRGFTIVDLVAIIVTLFFISLVFFSHNTHHRERARRVNCLSNQNGLWKAASAWGLQESLRPRFPQTNLAVALHAEGGITPEMFLCPSAAGEFWMRPALSLTNITTSNSSYSFYSGRQDADGDMVFICDNNGTNGVGTADNWGGNHYGMGGNLVKVAGQGMWVDSIETPGKFCITNENIRKAFFIADTNMIFRY